ncbi:hypothetical protein ATANTOWER_002715 [Ataeniobius toweri]|uniref:Uncharacterized protein n=1 Tax=Ataeniobius toweri TaxID=208326 RepID=A0ABU7C5T1_9TELE|nr:hypothetical protein [Ataeniobius toweri]
MVPSHRCSEVCKEFCILLPLVRFFSSPLFFVRVLKEELFEVEFHPGMASPQDTRSPFMMQGDSDLPWMV